MKSWITTRAPRIEINKRVLLMLSPDRGVVGTMKNVSETGAYIQTGYKPPDMQTGEDGNLCIMPDWKTRKIPCTVTRITEDGVGIQFLYQQYQQPYKS